MSTLDSLAAVAFCICGIFYIWHTGKALQTGFFVGWYNGSYQNYYVFRTKEPWKFYFNVFFMAVLGTLIFAVGVIIFDNHFFVFNYIRSFSE